MGLRLVAVAIALVFAASAARADDKPWAKGVSEANQKKALGFYEQGNAEFVEDHFKEALAMYEAALALWDHPAIRYNAAVCLINLDRPDEALDYLDSATKYGAEPIGKDHYAQALTYKKALGPRVSELEVTCNEPDAELSLDGKPLFRAPDTITRRVVVGVPHEIVAAKPRYETKRVPIVLTAGSKRTIEIKMTLIASGHLERRWATWKPWAVFAGGTAIAAIGGLFYWQAINNWNAYSKDCPRTVCVPDTANNTNKDAWRDYYTSIPTIAVGATLAAAGIALVILNKPRLVTPDVGRDHVAITLAGRW